MHYKWDKKYLYWGMTAFLVIAASILMLAAIFNWNVIIGFFQQINNALSPVMYGFIFAYLLSPVATFLEKSFMKMFTRKARETEQPYEIDIVRKKRTARVLSVAGAMCLFFLIIVGIIAIILPQLVETITKIINNSNDYFQQASAWVNSFLADYPEVQTVVNSSINDLSTTLVQWLKDTLLPQITDIMSAVSSGVGGVISVFFNVFFGFVICIYFLYNKELFAAQLKKITFSLLNPRYANAVLRNMREIHKTFGGFISGKLIDSFIIGMLFFIVLSIFNFPYAMLCSVLMGIFNIIPVFGPFIGAIPSVLLIFLEDPLYALYFIIVVCIIQQLDGNVLAPKILGESTGLSSFWVIFALLVGQSIFGFVGLIIGIPLFAVIYSFCRGRVGRALESKGLPSDSNVYRKVAYISDENELISLYEISENERHRKEMKQHKEDAENPRDKRRLRKKFK